MSTETNNDTNETAHPEDHAAPPKKRSRLGFKLAALVIAFTLSLLMAEAVLRLYVFARGWTANAYAGSVLLRIPDDENGYRLPSDFRMRSGAYAITTNSHGLRGPDATVEKTPGTTRIAILGGSSVFGYLVSDGQEAARLIEEKLTTDTHPVEVLNAGVPGYNLFQTTRRYNERIARFKPDIVVLYLGWNDLAYLISDNPDATEFQKGNPSPAWQRAMSVSTLYGLIAFRLLTPAAVFVPPTSTRAEPTEPGTAQFRKNLKQLIADIRGSGAKPVICAQAMAAHPEAQPDARHYLGATDTQQQQNAALGQWLHDAIRDVAAEVTVPFIDAFDEIPATTEMLGDAIHLTAAGEEQLADLLSKRLRPMLPEESSEAQEPATR